MTVLERFGVDPALIGDLVERRHAGASQVWFIRQASIAIAFKVVSDIRWHWVLALRAVAIGTVSTLILQLALNLPSRSMSRWLGVNVGNFLLEQNLDSARWVFFHYQIWSSPQVLVSMVCGAGAAWLVARTHRAHALSMVVLFLAAAEVYWIYRIAGVIRWAAAMNPNGFPYMPIVIAIMLIPTMLVVGFWSAKPETVFV